MGFPAKVAAEAAGRLDLAAAAAAAGAADLAERGARVEVVASPSSRSIRRFISSQPNLYLAPEGVVAMAAMAVPAAERETEETVSMVDVRAAAVARAQRVAAVLEAQAASQ